MKKIYMLFTMVLFCAAHVNAQISITQAEMPHSGDTARLTKAVNNPFLNYSATGANHNWDFTSLKADVQELRDFKSVSSTGLLYAIIYADIFFNPNRANVATSGTFAIPANGFLTIDNPYNFYYRNSSVYKQVGIGSDITAFNIPLGGIPTTFDQQDIIYNLPLNFADQDTSNSAYHITIPLVPFGYAFRQTRINNVDGWGSLQTPHGTYDVIRVKTTLLAHDSLGFDTLGIPPIEIDRAEVNEYKWLAANERVPILQINTQKILGIELITDIFFRDDFLNVYPNPGLSAAYCAGSAIGIPYTAEGTFNSGLFFNNQFRAQLSDANGSFANPVQIGQVTSKVSGTINATIPANTPEGSGYRIRIVSTSPAMEGPDNGADIYIATQPVSVITSNGGSTLCDSTSVSLSATVGTGYSYQWQLNGTDITGATSIGYVATQTGDYTVVTTNMCGTATSNIINITAGISPVAQITATSNIFCAGDSLLLSGNYQNGVSYQWLLNGNPLSGATDTLLYALQGGSYSLVATNGGCTATSAALPVTMENLATASITSSGNNAICTGDTLILSEISATGVTYQWQLNGTDITGETAATLTAFQTGDYDVVTSNICNTATSNIIHIDVLMSAMAVISSQGNSFCAGDSLLLNATYESGNSYQWLLDGNIVAGATDTIMYASQAGNYTLVASNGICADVTSAPLTVNLINPPTAAISSSGNNGICVGDTLTLTETSATGVTYQWQLNGSDITGETASSTIAFTTGDYDVVTTNMCGTATSNTIHIDVLTPPIATIFSSGNSFCTGDSLLLNATYENGNSYQWLLDGNIIAGATDTIMYASQAGNFVVVASNGICADVTSSPLTVNIINPPTSVISATGNTAICSGDSVVLDETSATGVSYQWQLNTTDITGEITASYTAMQAGDYTVITTNMCGIATSNIIHIDVSIPPVAVITSGSTSFCAGDSLMLNAFYGNGNSYQWLLDGNIVAGATDTMMYATLAGTYTVIVTADSVCPAVTSNAIVLNIPTAPSPNISASGNTTLCAGDSVVLNETTGSGATYQWQMNSVDITGATSVSYTVTQSGNYNVVASNTCGNSISNLIAVTVNPLPVAPVIMQNIDSLIATSAVAYQWYFNGVLISGANSQFYIPTQNGDYTVVITDANGCTNTSAIFIFNTVGINEAAATYMVTVTPNPVNDFFNLDFSSEKGMTISVSLFSSTGAEDVLSNTQRIHAGTNHLTFDLKPFSLAQGIYFVKVESDTHVVYKKLIKN
ncbi:MAG: PKD domain-containing protein [Bacteroidia bacterium]